MKNNEQPQVDTRKKGLVPLTPDEARVYFESDWYARQARELRQKLIFLGIIVKPRYHKYNLNAKETKKV